ncbi:MAG: RidA family protein [Chitinophagaceae bacterium]|uniref:RidA family protein n=1 Tax=unclassified Paraflavitalea TaxID=2798305 RepID=UPI003D32F38D|nr:RidA family protein [Chitinophagaceae bacterium]
MRKGILFLILIVGALQASAQTPEERLAAKGITLPTVSKPVATYVNVVRVGNLLYLSGKGPKSADGKDVTGTLGKDMTIEQGYEAAQSVALQHIAVLKDELGSLSKVKRIVKVLGMVKCTQDFIDQPKVVNGYSDMMVAVFGEKGKHARSAVGMYALPFNIAIEVEVIVEVE